MYLVGWLKVIICVLFSYVKCHPSLSNCNRSSLDCRNEFEIRMHPLESMIRSKRFGNGKIDKHHLINDYDYYDETSSKFWQSRAQFTVRNHLKRERNVNKAKNVIFFLGDGLSVPTITAARIYSGQLRGQSGEESHLSFEHFPHVGLSKTYCIDKQVPDSACTATAYLCGIKANYRTIGVNGRVQMDDCEAANNTVNHVNSMLALAQQAGKATGIVTTTTVTHASPAGNYAHTPNRIFECDADIMNYSNDTSLESCQDIASQLIHNNPGRRINVIFGGGRTKFLPKTTKDIEDVNGEREDGENLIDIWAKDKTNAHVIFNKNELENLNVKNTEYVLGLFAAGHLDYNLDANRTKQPSLMQMTETAIKILEKNENGFFLFVEGGRIDHGHHSAQAIKALDETVEFSNAIKRAVELTNHDDTLIVATSDHAHTMSIAGYPDRSNPITGVNTHLSDIDDLPTLTLSYANGPGYESVRTQGGSRTNITDIEIPSNFTYPGTYPSRAETHGGDDVAVFALGCMSHLFTGVYEQNTIPHLINYASCMGDDGMTVCNQFD